jgi:hypothetical protein
MESNSPLSARPACVHYKTQEGGSTIQERDGGRNQWRTDQGYLVTVVLQIRQATIITWDKSNGLYAFNTIPIFPTRVLQYSFEPGQDTYS